MIPLIKIMTVFAKTFSKPVIQIVKMHTRHRLVIFRRGFIYLGNKVYRVETFINRRFLGIESDYKTGNLPDEKAFDTGLSFILEIVILYGVLLGIAFSEVKKSIEEKKNAKIDVELLKTNVIQMRDELNAQIARQRVLENTMVQCRIGGDTLTKKLGELQTFLDEHDRQAKRNLYKINKSIDEQQEAIQEIKEETNVPQDIN